MDGHVEVLLKREAKELLRLRFSCLGAHSKPRRNLQEIYSQQRNFLQILRQGFPHIPNEIKLLWFFQHGLAKLHKFVGLSCPQSWRMSGETVTTPTAGVYKQMRHRESAFGCHRQYRFMQQVQGDCRDLQHGKCQHLENHI